MSVLNDTLLIDAIRSGDLNFEPELSIKRIQPASVDMTLDATVEEIPQGIRVDFASKEKLTRKEVVIGDDGYVLKPGQIVVGFTAEKMSLSKQITGRVYGRNSLVSWGLDVSASNYVNPGYSGKMPLCIRNTSNNEIVLRKGMRICQMVYIRVGTETIRNYHERHDIEAFGDVFEKNEPNFLFGHVDELDETYSKILSDTIKKAVSR